MIWNKLNGKYALKHLDNCICSCTGTLRYTVRKAYEWNQEAIANSND